MEKYDLVYDAIGDLAKVKEVAIKYATLRSNHFPNGCIYLLGCQVGGTLQAAECATDGWCTLAVHVHRYPGVRIVINHLGSVRPQYGRASNHLLWISIASFSSQQ